MYTWIYGTFFLFLVDVVGSFHIQCPNHIRGTNKNKNGRKREKTEQIGGVGVYVHVTAERKI